MPADACADAPRTTSGVDRLMNYQDRILLAMRYFHLSPGRRPTLLKSDGVRCGTFTLIPQDDDEPTRTDIRRSLI